MTWFNKSPFKFLILGFKGKNCELYEDHCSSAPCIMGHFDKCISYQTNYKCICKHGYFGVNCEIEKNECESSPCKNSGKLYF